MIRTCSAPSGETVRAGRAQRLVHGIAVVRTSAASAAPFMHARVSPPSVETESALRPDVPPYRAGGEVRSWKYPTIAWAAHCCLPAARAFS
jgi:hypothetical protein